MTRGLTLLLCLILTPALAQAAETKRGTYWVDFSGIPVGKLWVQTQESGDMCSSNFSLKTSGMVRIFEEHKSYATAKAQRSGEGWLPLSYSKRVDTSDEPDYVKLAYNDTGSLVKRAVEPEDNPNWRKPVPAEDLAGVWHPAVMLCGLTESMKSQAIGSTKVHPVYDGKRYFAVYVKRENDTRYSLSREAIAGFTPKELAKIAEGEPPLYLYVSAKDSFPNRLELTLPIGTINARFVAE